MRHGGHGPGYRRIVALVVWAVARRPELRDLSAREQLDARLASGAIDTQEYRERLDALGR
jgi:hypothetical protein